MTKICGQHHWSVVHLSVALILCLVTFALAEDTSHENGTSPSTCHGGEEVKRYEVVSLEWDEVQVPFGICVWIMIASLAKLGFHYTRLPEFLPESCLLIIIGLVVGGIISINPKVFPASLSSGLDTDLFFLFLLPPIMLEAGYFMPSRSFFDNIGTILMYAVFGTLFNTMTIGFSLYGISQLGWFSTPGPNGTVHVTLLECLTFSSLISAVDPVAVLAVFEEVHVNEVLYILVFGESLLNDAVTVVLYRMFESFNAIGADNLMAIDIVGGFFSFFVVAIGGVLIGLMYGFLTSLLTRLTHKARVIEPIFVFAMAYMAYLTAEMFRLSSILSIVFCAIFMKPYVEANISQKSHTTIKYFLKMLSSISETIIFIFLGVTTLVDPSQHKWNTVFVISTLVFCLLYRSIGVIMQTWVANTFRLARICRTEQFIMAYGGLRGAIAFSLVALLCKETVPSKQILFTACIVVILFTVFIQGTTIKPLVDKLKVKRATKHKPSMNEEIFERLGDHLMVGIEEILGQYGHHHWRDKWEHLNKRFIEPMLLHERRKLGDPKILEVFSKLNEKDAKDYIKSHGSFIQLQSNQSLSNILRTQSSDMLCTGSAPFSALPVNDSVPCLDMQQMGTNVPTKLFKESSSHHLDLLADNMYKPQRHNNHRRSRHMDVDIQEPTNLMHRSMKIQLRRISQKQGMRHGRGTNPLLNLALKNSSSDKHLARRHHLEQNHNKEPENLPASAEHPAVIVTLQEEDEDEGITFSAKESFDEADAGIDKSTDEIVQTACEKTLPWKTENNPEVSVRAEINPHQFVMEFPQSPRKVPPAKPLVSPSDSTTDDSLPLTAAEQLPWKSGGETSPSSHGSLDVGDVKFEGTGSTKQDVETDDSVEDRPLEGADRETRL
ncbi:sodium/hydrogen exchanger 3-like isoform X2 [Patiria miniata]|uniref:Sodium/hydrogen exchanger n=1 Tax=Patiria miniata TaxID=46514 RepID=A0A914B364_PATMI|nr:sodium/hydrogen exchanger 3-like isoform X2 [Patiria miniata]